MNYRIIPLKEGFTDNARHAFRDDMNQPVERVSASGGEPCRDVFRRALPGEQIILASYCPFSQSGPYKEYGPVFILATQPETAVNTDNLSLTTLISTGYLGDNFVLKAYCNKQRITDARQVTAADAETVLSELLQDRKTAFVIARYTAYGCYSLRIERC